MCIEPFEPRKIGVCERRGWSVFGDLDAYLRLCESGQLYESLAADGDARDDVKRRLFVVFFGKPHWRSPVAERFTERFPSVARMLRDLKRDDYRRAAWLMQHAESSLFIGTICRRIMREQPSVPILTIHDSLVTTATHVRYVETVIRDEFGKLGVTPTLKEEHYGPAI